MKERRHGSLGILVKDIGAEIQSGLFSLILSVAKDNNYALLLEQLPVDLNDKMILLDDFVVDGLIIFSEMPPEIMSRLKNIQEEVLYFNTNKREGADVITIADEEAGYAATKFLADAGRKKIAYISWGETGNLHYSIQARRAGVLKCCEEMNLEFVLDFNIDEVATHFINYKKATNYILEKIADRDIDGIVLHTDIVAPALYNAVGQLGEKIPQDYSVVSFNNSSISYSLQPKLVSFGLDEKKAAKLIVERMIDLINGKKNLETIELSMNFFDGESV
ncbi:MAG: substrate-binding domain-containing protein [Kiritimatiellae bacterium]|jgi:LacI family transcriptional regulator|nr:substrate-binding domain-containing protein [Kiritimatiellia bacterium]